MRTHELLVPGDQILGIPNDHILTGYGMGLEPADSEYGGSDG